MKFSDIPETKEGVKALALIQGLISKSYLQDREVKSARLEFSIKALSEAGIEIEEEDLIIFLKDQAGVLEQRKDVFHPEHGAVKYFAVNNQPMSAAITTGNLNTAIERVITKINEVSVSELNITQEALDNKNKVILLLDAGLTNENDKGDTPPFDDKELKIIQELKDKLDVKEQTYTLKESEFKVLKLTADSLSAINALDVGVRDKYYRYWKTVSEDFQNIHDYLIFISPLLQEEVKDRLGLVSPEEKDLAFELGGVIIPNYVIKVSPIPRKELTDEFKTQEIVYNFLKMVGKTIPEAYKPFSAGADGRERVQSTMQEEAAFDEQGNPSGNVGGSIDETVADEVEADIEDAIKVLETTEVFVDPLYLILGRDKKKAQDFKPAVIAAARKEIQGVMRTNSTSKYLDELNELLDGEIDEFLDTYKDAQASAGDEFSLPAMDNDYITKMFDDAKVSIKVEYSTSEKHETQDKEFSKYSDAVKFINKETKAFFRILGEAIKLTKGTVSIARRAVDPQGRGVGMTAAGPGGFFLGGESLPQPVKRSEADADRLQQMDSILELVNRYHNEPLSGDMVLLSDVPEFYTSSAFRDFPSILSGTRKQKVKTALKQGYKPFVNSGNYEKVMNWLDLFKDLKQLTLTETLVEQFEDAREAFIAFWQNIAMIAEPEEANPITQINEEITSVFGSMLYEIGMDSYGDREEAFAQYKWRTKNLRYWHLEQESKNYTIDNLLSLLEDPDWKVFIEGEMNKDKKLRRKHFALIGKLKRPLIKNSGPITHAMLEASDMIRKMSGERVYKNYLDVTDIEDLTIVIDIIKKENKIDIYGVDIHSIVESQSSFNDISQKLGMPTEVVYKVKGMFR
tara:strand:+ start:2274 stop:4838 length:2565 start_codon:yes stop_codon:yes gene_type:complete